MKKFAEISPEQLLSRPSIEVDLAPARALVQGRRVLVTGAAGSIGSELARQLADLAPSRLALVDQAETPLHSLQLSLPRESGAEFCMADCASPASMRRIFSRLRPDVIFHAAAYKHVPMMEADPHAAIANNVASTKLLADLAREFKAECFVMVSTDKAVNPTNVMGASKRACELYVQALPHSPTRFITTRFGNVLGSQGSVIPLFLRQLRSGGPLTVTHPEVRRFFMLIPEASRLVLLAAALGRGGEIFAFDMGEPVRIADLARRIITLGGNGSERIVYTGLRNGEKLYEEVLTADETTLPGPHPKIKVARVRPVEFSAVERQISELIRLADSPDSTPRELVGALKRLVPEFLSPNSPYRSLDYDAAGSDGGEEVRD